MKPIQSLMGGSPAPVIIPPPTAAPAPKKVADDITDPEAARMARERAEQEKLRRGRRSLRLDLAPSTASGGSGVYIPG